MQFDSRVQLLSYIAFLCNMPCPLQCGTGTKRVKVLSFPTPLRLVTSTLRAVESANTFSSCVVAILNPGFALDACAWRAAIMKPTAWGVVGRQLVSHPGEPCFIPGWVVPKCSHVGIVLNDATGRQGFLDVFPFPLAYFIPVLLHTNLASPSPALKTPMSRAAQISSLDTSRFDLLVAEASSDCRRGGSRLLHPSPRRCRPYSNVNGWRLVTVRRYLPPRQDLNVTGLEPQRDHLGCFSIPWSTYFPTVKVAAFRLGRENDEWNGRKGSSRSLSGGGSVSCAYSRSLTSDDCAANLLPSRPVLAFELRHSIEYGAAPESRDGGNGRSPRKLADQRIVWHDSPLRQSDDPAGDMKKEKLPGLDSRRTHPDFRVWETWRTLNLPLGFLGVLPFIPPIHSSAAPSSPAYNTLLRTGKGSWWFSGQTTRLSSRLTGVLLPVGSLPDLRMWESCRTMPPLVGGFSRGSPVYGTLAFRHCSVLTLLRRHQLSRPRCDERPETPHSALGQGKLPEVKPRRATSLNVVPAAAVGRNELKDIVVMAYAQIIVFVTELKILGHRGVAVSTIHGRGEMVDRLFVCLQDIAPGPLRHLTSLLPNTPGMPFRAPWILPDRSSCIVGGCVVVVDQYGSRMLLVPRGIRATTHHCRHQSESGCYTLIVRCSTTVRVLRHKVKEWHKCQKFILLLLRRRLTPTIAKEEFRATHSTSTRRDGICFILIGHRSSQRNTSHYCGTSFRDGLLQLFHTTRLPPRRARFYSRPGSLPDFGKWESCRTLPLVGEFSWGLSFPPPFPSGAAPYSPQSPTSALKTSMLRAVHISSSMLPGVRAAISVSTFGNADNRHVMYGACPVDISARELSSRSLVCARHGPVSGWAAAERSGNMCAFPQTSALRYPLTPSRHLKLDQTAAGHSSRLEIRPSSRGISLRVFMQGADLPWRSRLARHRCGKSLGSNPGCLSGAHRITSNHNVFGGQVVDYWWRVEFQCRGSPHLHMVVWVKDHPNLNDLPRARVRACGCHAGSTSREKSALKLAGSQAIRMTDEPVNDPLMISKTFCLHSASGKLLDSHSRGPGVDSRSSHTDFGLLLFPEITLAISALASHQREPGLIPGRVTGFSQVGIVQDDAVDRRVFSGISRYPRQFIPVPLHIHFNHSHWVSRPRRPKSLHSYLRTS
ncbi:hypothetical protein PR048_021846 [Dryococelus australis]|uniref:Uncharacterized protein n=1 Tax=Dryococelus australis TaxID=614101 RepID=A0ABQ9GZG3_9NEOP|nr:hypothetical protein PR048_021846 [Dryococelus australis]